MELWLVIELLQWSFKLGLVMQLGWLMRLWWHMELGWVMEYWWVLVLWWLSKLSGLFEFGLVWLAPGC